MRRGTVVAAIAQNGRRTPESHHRHEGRGLEILHQHKGRAPEPHHRHEGRMLEPHHHQYSDAHHRPVPVPTTSQCSTWLIRWITHTSIHSTAIRHLHFVITSPFDLLTEVFRQQPFHRIRRIGKDRRRDDRGRGRGARPKRIVAVGEVPLHHGATRVTVERGPRTAPTSQARKHGLEYRTQKKNSDFFRSP